eukprot:GSChrysophyteH1.ASY1.ANO1.1559.1 assembled CDS
MPSNAVMHSITMSSEDPLFLLQRRVHSSSRDLRARLLSIVCDSKVVDAVRMLLVPEKPFPIFANKRCGCWYQGEIEKFDGEAYFKSTDGHIGTWHFSLSRLNLGMMSSAIRNGGMVLIDSTRKGKTFPDSFTYTVPLWCGCINAILGKYFRGLYPCVTLAAWVPASIAAQFMQRIGESLESIPSEVLGIIYSAASLAIEEAKSASMKPLIPIWVSPDQDVVLNALCSNETAIESLPFIPLLLLSCSAVNASHLEEWIRDIINSHVATRSWEYIQGAGDDEESWSLGLTPRLFWRNVRHILGIESTKDSLLLPVMEAPEAIANRVRALVDRQSTDEVEEDGDFAAGNHEQREPSKSQEFILIDGEIRVVVSNDIANSIVAAKLRLSSDERVISINASEDSVILNLRLSHTKTSKMKLRSEWSSAFRQLRHLRSSGFRTCVLFCTQSQQHLGGAVALGLVLLSKYSGGLAVETPLKERARVLLGTMQSCDSCRDWY